MNVLRKAVIKALTVSVVALGAGHAGAADDITYSGTAVTASISPTQSSWSFNTLPTTALFGWSHTSNWKTLEVTTPGDVWVRLSQTAPGQRHGAFTLWSIGDGNTFNHNTDGTQHRYNQVRGPNDAANMSAWLGTPGDGKVTNNVDFILGYGNTGVTFTNADGDFVGYGQVFDSAQSVNSVNPHIDASGSSSTTVSAAHGDFAQGGGIEYTELFLKNLQPGHYLFVVGGSAANSSNYGVAGPLSLVISPTAVPVPASLWLLGSAMAGLGVFGRRKPLI